jgi:hypothetical protein
MVARSRTLGRRRSRLSGKALGRPREIRNVEREDRRMKARVLLLLAGVALLTAARSSAEQLPADLQQAIRARDEARFKKDAATWDRLTTADFTLVNADGRIMTKAERLTQMKSEEPESPRMAQQQQVTRYGDTVILREKQQDGAWVISVWVKDAHAWRVAAVQITTIAKK